jgi:hypothetical protein
MMSCTVEPQLALWQRKQQLSIRGQQVAAATVTGYKAAGSCSAARTLQGLTCSSLILLEHLSNVVLTGARHDLRLMHCRSGYINAGWLGRNSSNSSRLVSGPAQNQKLYH